MSVCVCVCVCVMCVCVCVRDGWEGGVCLPLCYPRTVGKYFQRLKISMRCTNGFECACACMQAYACPYIYNLWSKLQEKQFFSTPVFAGNHGLRGTRGRDRGARQGGQPSDGQQPSAGQQDTEATNSGGSFDWELDNDGDPYRPNWLKDYAKRPGVLLTLQT